VLEPAEFLDAGSLLETSGWLKQQFREDADKFPLLAARCASLGRFSGFADGDPAMCSAQRGDQRRRVQHLAEDSREHPADARLDSKDASADLRSRQAESGEDYVTLRNDRFVIPVRSEHRRNVPGVVHGASGTGQTVFVEPFETVETNNQLVQRRKTKPRRFSAS